MHFLFCTLPYRRFVTSTGELLYFLSSQGLYAFNKSGSYFFIKEDIWVISTIDTAQVDLIARMLSPEYVPHTNLVPSVPEL